MRDTRCISGCRIRRDLSRRRMKGRRNDKKNINASASVDRVKNRSECMKTNTTIIILMER